MLSYMVSCIVYECQQTDDLTNLDLDKAGLHLFAHYVQIGCRDRQTQLLWRTVRENDADMALAHGFVGEEIIAAPAGKGRVLRVNDIVAVNEREPVEREQGLNLTEGSPELLLGGDALIIDKGKCLFHVLKITVDQIGDRLRTPVGHGLSPKDCSR